MEINPENDKAINFELNLRNATTGALEPVTSGTVTAIIATSDGSTATEAVGTSPYTAVHVGGANGFVVGTWMVFINALGSAVLSALPKKLYLIARKAGDIRTVVELENVDARYAQVGS